MSEETVVSTMPAVINIRLPRRVKLTDQQFEKINLEEMIHNWHEQDVYIDFLESQAASQEAEIASLREAEERMRQQHLESTHREKVLVRRLATKEQEMQEYASQIAEFKAGQTAGSSALRSALLDPAVNLLLQLLRGELMSTRTRLEETQNELSAWKFTPDSNTGKRLMAKCRLLYQENEELGRMISSGRLAKLEGELALQKSFSDEVKKSQSELDEFLQDLDEDVEGMQSTIYYLQQELRKSKEAYLSLQQQKNQPEVLNGFLPNSILPNGMLPNSILPNQGSLGVVKDCGMPGSVEVKAEPEPYSSKPSSPLEREETGSQALAEDAGGEVEEKTSDENEEVPNMKSEPIGTSGDGNVANPKFSPENKAEEKDAGEEEGVVTYSETMEVVDEVIENEDSGREEMKEETDDQDSQGELMIEVGSEPRDSEDEEENYEKPKVEEKASVSCINGVIIQETTSRGNDGDAEEEEEEVAEKRPLRRKKRAAPESTHNSSDEDSDDTPLIKKVRRHHELMAKSKGWLSCC
ncbi:pre-mRNA-splicing regulator WTAP [Ischnura elegans]|uniref:pre-mRNA-splicing regulator WTAP n=1 Tax=Ischnura elegans TaxID=197161 RepID=UPI001ED8B230|nr:pre-mRNA-splicing regulator WTAP [Ischnura elegans]